MSKEQPKQIEGSKASVASLPIAGTSSPQPQTNDPAQRTWTGLVVAGAKKGVVIGAGMAAPIPSVVATPLVDGAAEILQGKSVSSSTQQKLNTGLKNAAVGAVAAAGLFLLAPAGAGLVVAGGLFCAATSIATGLDAGERIGALLRPSNSAAQVQRVASIQPDVSASFSIERVADPEAQVHSPVLNSSSLRIALEADSVPPPTQNPRGASSSPRSASPKATSPRISGHTIG